MSEPLLVADNLTIKYRTSSGSVKAVSDASFTIPKGEYFGLVGESGCGKSTIAKSIIGGLDVNGEITGGKVRYKGREIQDMSETELNREIRWKEISWIPQSSMNSLDPLQRMSDQAIELGKVHTDLDESELRSRIKEMFDIVGLQPTRVTDYPHQFSGGMQQRAVIAFALFLEPSLIIADEPTTALDVITQDQIFAHLDRIQSELDMSILLITHDISLVFESCGKVAIMHGGQVAETGSATDIYDTPRHPYSVLLQRAFPDVRYPDRDLEVIGGLPPQLESDDDFCSFVDRCPWAIEECRESAPPLEAVDDDDHVAACYRKGEMKTLQREPYEQPSDGGGAESDD